VTDELWRSYCGLVRCYQPDKRQLHLGYTRVTWEIHELGSAESANGAHPVPPGAGRDPAVRRRRPDRLNPIR